MNALGSLYSTRGKGRSRDHLVYWRGGNFIRKRLTVPSRSNNANLIIVTGSQRLHINNTNPHAHTLTHRACHTRTHTVWNMMRTTFVPLFCWLLFFRTYSICSATCQKVLCSKWKMCSKSAKRSKHATKITNFFLAVCVWVSLFFVSLSVACCWCCCCCCLWCCQKVCQRRGQNDGVTVPAIRAGDCDWQLYWVSKGVRGRWRSLSYLWLSLALVSLLPAPFSVLPLSALPRSQHLTSGVCGQMPFSTSFICKYLCY